MNTRVPLFAHSGRVKRPCRIRPVIYGGEATDLKGLAEHKADRLNGTLNTHAISRSHFERNPI